MKNSGRHPGISYHRLPVGGDLGGLAGADQHCHNLARAVGAGNHTWRAYLSTNLAGGSVNARDRIGHGPWRNPNGVVIAQSVLEASIKYVAAGGNPMFVKRGIDKALPVALAELERQARPVEVYPVLPC